MQRFLTTLEGVFGQKEAEVCVVLGEVYAGSYTGPEVSRHLRSIARLSYRRGFSLLPYAISTDAGWGCMVRVAQSLMARALVVHHLGRNWRVGEGGDAELGHLQCSQEYCEVISHFLDYPGRNHLYGLPNVASVGMRYGKLPGEWFGGHSIALVMRDLASVHHHNHRGGMQVYVPSPQGNVVNMDEVEALCFAQNLTGVNETPNLNFDPLLHVPPDSEVREWKSALVILLPLRLGSIRIFDDCADELRELLKTNENCLGFLGGTPSRALYVIGLHQSTFLCIDPHTIEQHPSLCAPFPSESLRNSLHQDRVRLVDASSLDPSMTVGFYFPCRASFLDWSRSHQARSPKSNLFTVQDFASDLAESHAEDQDENDDDEDYVIV